LTPCTVTVRPSLSLCLYHRRLSGPSELTPSTRRADRSEVGQECVKKLQADGAKFDEKGAQIL